MLQGLLYAALLVCVAGYMVAWLLFSKAYLEKQEPDVSLLVWTAAPAESSQNASFGANTELCGCHANNTSDVCNSYASEIPNWGRFDAVSYTHLTLPTTPYV